ncbi:MAG: class I SAM-dependent methyltransferase [Candidatus Sericytochromatia bacterium]|nr:class I SAM-dependent methyltransferase [Candidatus Sericytochromatia bacterium]
MLALFWSAASPPDSALLNALQPLAQQAHALTGDVADSTRQLNAWLSQHPAAWICWLPPHALADSESLAQLQAALQAKRPLRASVSERWSGMQRQMLLHAPARDCLVLAGPAPLLLWRGQPANERVYLTQQHPHYWPLPPDANPHLRAYQRLCSRRLNAAEAEPLNTLLNTGPAGLQLPLHLKKLPWFERYLSEIVHWFLSRQPGNQQAVDWLNFGLQCCPKAPSQHWLASSLQATLNNHAAAERHLLQLQQLLASPGPFDLPQQLTQPGYLPALHQALQLQQHLPQASFPEVGLPNVNASTNLKSWRAAWQTLINPFEALERSFRPQDRLGHLALATGSLEQHALSWWVQQQAYLPDPAQQLGFALARHEWAAGQRQRARSIACRALRNEMSNSDKLKNIWDLLARHGPDCQGDWVELGCHTGHTSVLLQWFRQLFGHSGALHVYDSFEGLPPPGGRDDDTPFASGMCRAARAELEARFALHDLPLPRIYPGWFAQTLPQQLPEQIALAYLDGDFYESIMESLQAIAPRLLPGALVLIDDYFAPVLPGVKAAFADFNRSQGWRLRRIRRSRCSTAYVLMTPQAGASAADSSDRPPQNP